MTVMRVVMVVLVRMCELIVAVRMSVLLMRILWSRARRMGMLMMRIVVGVRVGMCDFVVSVRMRMLSHIYCKRSDILDLFASDRASTRTDNIRGPWIPVAMVAHRPAHHAFAAAAYRSQT